MEFDDQSVDVGNVDDRRGVGGGLLLGGGGLGVVGVIIYLVVTLLGGGQPGSGVQTGLPAGGGGGGQQGETRDQLRARCNSAGALQKYTDCRLIKDFNVADTVWRAEFARRKLTYASPRFVFFTQRTQTGCGPASAQVGPFYCPADQELYFELGFLQQLQDRFGAQGEFAQAYIVAHEFGHHLQTLLGTERQVRAQEQRDPARANELSVKLELQADCYAGVWATLADRTAGNGITLTQDNIAEAVNAAQAVGDDRIQAKTQGQVNPETWTHGSSAQRKQWFLTGYRSGSPDSCRTFG
ncbi:MAG TPA: neutral zinc metallopeptidase [Kineosporiaceae bacterium]|nr:neutral zinc metallopeptidase [Kineosporiaceae bacterium]